MNYRTLGNTNLKVSEIGCGGIPLQRVSKDTAYDIVSELINQGINFIDSARGYTVSESLFGCAIEGRRERFVLATKSMARTYDAMLNDIKTSLSNFKTNYIDLYQMHNLRGECDYSGAIKALLEAKEKGQIKHIGLTSHSYEFIEKVLNEEVPYYDIFETIQFPYNFIEDKANDLFLKANKKGIGVIVMKPLAGGNIDNANIALKYILNNESVNVAIPGMDSIDQVKENASVSQSDIKLNDEETKYIGGTKNKLGNDFCRRCGYCQPCTKGIDIANCFLFENYVKKYNLKDWAFDRYNGLKVKASECIECHMCESRCPYGLNITKKLKSVVETFGE